MTRFCTLARASAGIALVVALASACGGQSVKARETGDAGSGGTAPTAGSTASGGTMATGGTMAGTFTACQAATDCVLGYPGCCGVCEGPDVTADDFLAYNKRYEAEVRTQQCGEGAACGPCPTREPRTNTRPYFVPNCVRFECVVEDIRESDVTACKTSEDCRLRSGTACCAGCGDRDFVAVRRDGSLEKLVCGELDQICLDCVAFPPEGAEAQCSGQGHCIVRYLLDEQTP